MNKTQGTIPVIIKIRNGTLRLRVNRLPLPGGVCKNCKKNIYWLKVKGKSLQVNHIGSNEFILHSLICPVVIKYEKSIESRKYYQVKKKSNLTNK